MRRVYVQTCIAVLVCILAACGGKKAASRATGAFTCPSPPMPAEQVASCQAQHKYANQLTLDIQQDKVTGDATIDGELGGAEPRPTCMRGQHLAIKITGTYDRLAHTLTGTFSADITPSATGTCPNMFRPSHNDALFHATVSGNNITGQSGVLFFEATLR